LNILSWAGYWFYRAESSSARAASFASWGLLTDAPDVEPPTFFKRLTDWFWEFF
jgi:hypothetical protein